CITRTANPFVERGIRIHRRQLLAQGGSQQPRLPPATEHSEVVEVQRVQVRRHSQECAAETTSRSSRGGERQNAIAHGRAKYARRNGLPCIAECEIGER